MLQELTFFKQFLKQKSCSVEPTLRREYSLMNSEQRRISPWRLLYLSMLYEVLVVVSYKGPLSATVHYGQAAHKVESLTTSA